MSDIGVGLLGYGLGGRVFHAPYARTTAGMTLKAVVTRYPAKVHADMPNMEVVDSVDALLADSGIHLVVISSPDMLHAEHAMAALKAGKHVLVDKPFTTTVADARMVAAAGEAAGRLVAVYHNRRWDSDFLTLRKLIAENALGEVFQFESHFDRWRPDVPSTWKESRPGGTWQNLGPHLVDQALQLFGAPDAVSADIATIRAGGTSSDYFHVSLRYPRRCVLLHSNMLIAGHDLRFAVHGTRGSWIKCGTDPQEAAAQAGRLPGEKDWGVDLVEGTLTDGDGHTVKTPNLRGDYCQLWRQLASAIRGETPNPLPADAGLAAVAIIEAGLRSAQLRSEVML